jgi:hypothetical protein
MIKVDARRHGSAHDIKTRSRDLPVNPDNGSAAVLPSGWRAELGKDVVRALERLAGGGAVGVRRDRLLANSRASSPVLSEEARQRALAGRLGHLDVSRVDFDGDRHAGLGASAGARRRGGGRVGRPGEAPGAARERGCRGSGRQSDAGNERGGE